MASAQRREHSRLIDTLLAEPYRFGFFQAVRILRRARLEYEADKKNSNCLPAFSQLRFRSHLSLSFPASELTEIKSPAGHDLSKAPAYTDKSTPTVEDSPLEMTVAFMGLIGPSGVLPHHYTEQIIKQVIQHRDRAAYDWLDIFTHRKVSLFFQAWYKHQPLIDLEYSAESKELHSYTRWLLSLEGLGQFKSHRTKSDEEISTHSLAYFGGHLQQRGCSSIKMQSLLSDYFQCPVQVVPYQGSWVTMPREEHMLLGTQNMRLGQETILGMRSYSRQNKIGIELGPLTKEQFDDLLPRGKGSRYLKRWLEILTSHDYIYQIVLIFKRPFAQPAQLGGEISNSHGIGWNAWLGSPPTIRENLNETRYDITWH